MGGLQTCGFCDCCSVLWLSVVVSSGAVMVSDDVGLGLDILVDPTFHKCSLQSVPPLTNSRLLEGL